MEEIWRDVKGYEGHYQASSLGRIRNLITGKIIGNDKPSNIRGDYLNCSIGAIHRIIAETFIPNPDNKPEVNHKNLDKTDNRIENLEWVTKQENMDHYWSSKDSRILDGYSRRDNEFIKHFYMGYNKLKDNKGFADVYKLAKMMRIPLSRVAYISKVEPGKWAYCKELHSIKKI